MRRSLLLILFAAAPFAFVACGGDSAATTTTVTAPVTAAPAVTTAAPVTTAPATTAPPTTATTTTDSAAPETTVATGTGAVSIRIDEIVFAGEPYLVIGNQGGAPGSTAGLWICQFPSYYELPDVELQPGEKLVVPLGDDTVPPLVGVVEILDVQSPLGAVSTADGELGLYSTNAFNSPDAILDYVEWGASGHPRSEVAVAAGIWVAGGFVDVPEEVLAIVAQSTPTLGPDDWFAEIGG